MAIIESNYGSSGQAITCTFTSLANNAQRCSAAINNTSNLALDAFVFVQVKIGAVGGNGPSVNVYAYGTADGGTTYSDGVPGTDSTVTLTTPPNMRLIGVINTTVASGTYYGGPFSVAAAFGGVLPDHWGIVVENKTGSGSLDASVGSAWYQNLLAQTV